MSNLMSISQRLQNDAVGSMGNLAELDRRSELAEQQMDAADSAAKSSNVMAGAGMGWMIGAKVGAGFGPAGMALGAGIGYLSSELF